MVAAARIYKENGHKVVDDLRKRVDFCGQVGEGDLCRFDGRGEPPFVLKKQKGPSEGEG